MLSALARPTLGHLDPDFLALMDEVRRMLRETFRTQNELTFPVSGTGTAGMETCLVNLLEPGDEALVLACGVFGLRMGEIVERTGARLHLLRAPFGKGFEPAQVEETLRGKNVKLVAFVHAETSTGYLQEVEPIARVARQAGALTVTDMVTSLGGVPVEVDGWGVDAAFSATQKCLGCPPGLAPVTFSPRALEAIDRRRTKVQSWYLDVSLLRKYWGSDRAYHHTAPINMVYGLHEALRLLRQEGLAARWKRHRAAAAALTAGIEKLGLELLVEPAHRLPQLTSIRVPEGLNDKEVRQALLRKHGIEIGGGLGELAGKVWRIGLMGEGARPAVVRKVLRALGAVLGRRRR